MIGISWIESHRGEEYRDIVHDMILGRQVETERRSVRRYKRRPTMNCKFNPGPGFFDTQIMQVKLVFLNVNVYLCERKSLYQMTSSALVLVAVFAYGQNAVTSRRAL